ncbi:MAG: STAS domain-containing protein [Clostridia bacterium]|nr:STAS domain-containing protein [Clostridia bacterium]MBP5767329.1 STAS domain-containing protein [Clostridia bacterium]
MLNLSSTVENGKAVITAEGKIDTVTAPELENEICGVIPGITGLVIDFAGVNYISSAGLRVLLRAQKKMAERGSMKLTNVSADVMQVFDVTGFSDFLTVE